MTHCKFRKADGCFIEGSRWDVPPHDDATEVVIDLPDYPDARTERWDGATGVRAATTQEMADYDDAKNDVDAQSNLDKAINKALRDILLNLEARMIQAGVTADAATIPAAVRQPEIAAATNVAEYTTALKNIVKSYL